MLDAEYHQKLVELDQGLATLAQGRQGPNRPEHHGRIIDGGILHGSLTRAEKSSGPGQLNLRLSVG